MNTDHAVPPEIMATKFPKGFTARDEAHAIVALMFEKGVTKQLATDLLPAIKGDMKPRRVADKKRRKQMLDAAIELTVMFEMRESNPEQYRALLMGVSMLGYSGHWLREEPGEA